MAYHQVCSLLRHLESFVVLWNQHCSLVHFQLCKMSQKQSSVLCHCNQFIFDWWIDWLIDWLNTVNKFAYSSKLCFSPLATIAASEPSGGEIPMLNGVFRQYWFVDVLLTVTANPSRRHHAGDIRPWRVVWLRTGVQCTVCWHWITWHDGTYVCAFYAGLCFLCWSPYPANGLLLGWPLPSARQRPSYGDCLKVKREYYQNCFVLDCVTQCSQSAAHLYEHFFCLLYTSDAADE